MPKNELVFELAEVWHMDIMRRRIEMNCKVVSRSARSQKLDLGARLNRLRKKAQFGENVPMSFCRG